MAFCLASTTLAFTIYALCSTSQEQALSAFDCLPMLLLLQLNRTHTENSPRGSRSDANLAGNVYVLKLNPAGQDTHSAA